MKCLELREHKGEVFYWADDPASLRPESILAFNYKKDASVYIKQHTTVPCIIERIGNRFWMGYGLKLEGTDNTFLTKSDRR